MEKPTLSPQGVEEKMKSLYALNDSTLEAEAALISSDLRGWLLANFEVTEAQQLFLNQLSDSYVTALTEQTARAVRHRWPIIFISNASQMAQLVSFLNLGKFNRIVTFNNVPILTGH